MTNNTEEYCPIELKQLDVCDIHVDIYQRDRIRKWLIKEISTNFSPILLGVPVVALRISDNTYYFVDGQHRGLGLMAYNYIHKESPIKTITCLVFESHNRKEEAYWFDLLQTKRRPLTILEKYKARVVGEIEPEISIDRFLVENGMKIGSTKNNTTIGFAAKFIRTWNLDSASAKAAAIEQNNLLLYNENMKQEIHEGLWYLYRNGIPVHSYRKKITQEGGKTAMIRAINELDGFARKTKNSSTTPYLGPRTYALAILSIINHRKRDKVLLPE